MYADIWESLPEYKIYGLFIILKPNNKLWKANWKAKKQIFTEFWNWHWTGLELLSREEFKWWRHDAPVTPKGCKPFKSVPMVYWKNNGWKIPHDAVKTRNHLYTVRILVANLTSDISFMSRRHFPVWMHHSYRIALDDISSNYNPHMQYKHSRQTNVLLFTNQHNTRYIQGSASLWGSLSSVCSLGREFLRLSPINR